MFGGTNGDVVDEGNGGIDELDVASVGSDTETVSWRSGCLRRAPDHYSPSKMGGLAVDWNMDLVYSFITNPTTVLAAFYSKFQHLNYDSVANTVDDELPISLMVRATEKDDLTWFEAQKSNKYNQFRNAALNEIKNLEDKGSWEVEKRSEASGKNILPLTWAFKRLCAQNVDHKTTHIQKYLREIFHTHITTAAHL